MGTFTFRIEEMVNFSVNTDHGLAMTGMDFVSTVVAQRNPGQTKNTYINKDKYSNYIMDALELKIIQRD